MTIVNRILCLIALAIPSYAALASTTVWEVRTTGNDANGAAFTAGGAGTDMSQFDNKNAASCSSCQSATVNISTTDAVTNNTTTVTSATANFSAALIDNVVRITGTGTTSGWYRVTAVGSATSITVDRATGSTGGSGVTLNIGGALVTPLGVGGVVAGNTVWVRAGAGYSTASAYGFVPTGGSATRVTVSGYTTTRGDGGSVTVTATANTGGAFVQLGGDILLQNFIVDCGSQTGTSGVNSGANSMLSNIVIQNCKVSGLIPSGDFVLINSIIKNGASGCTAGISGGNFPGQVVIGTRITGNACSGIVGAGSSAFLSIIHCVIDNNTTDGIQFTLNNTHNGQVINSTIYGNGRDGIRATVDKAFEGAWFLGNLIVGNAGVGVNSTITTYLVFPGDYNFFYNNTGGNLAGVPASTHQVIGSADPFVNAAGGNFALNSNPGGGLAAKGAGFPGVLLSGGTGYADIGALPRFSAVTSFVKVGSGFNQ